MNSKRQWLSLLLGAAMVCSPVAIQTDARLVGAGGIVSAAYAEEQPIEETPAPSNVPEPVVTPEESATPVPTEAPQGDATTEPAAYPTPAQNAPISVSRLYFTAPKEATPGERVTIELVLRADLPDGSTLAPFGVRLEHLDGLDAQLQTLSDRVTYTDGLLWVEHATVTNGRVCVGGSSLALAVTLLPFPDTSEHDSVTLSWVLLDSAGHSAGLADRSDEEHKIRHKLTIKLITAAETEISDGQPTPPVPEATGMPESTSAPAGPEEVPVPEAIPSQQPAEAPVPEETAAPASTAAEPSPSQQPAEAPVPEETAAPVPTVAEQAAYLEHNIAPSDLRVGDTLVLVARLVGFDGVQMNIRWQQCHNGVWSDVEGAQGFTFQILITDENLHDSWRYVAEPMD